jgi:hypothetical protein
MASILSSTKTKERIDSLKPLISKADQQLITEFLVNSSQAENPVELWKLSANDTSYIHIYIWRIWNRY